MITLLFIFQNSLLGLILGLLYTLIGGSAEGQGLAAGGILVFNALIGLMAGVLSGVFYVIRMGHEATRKANKVVAIINFVCMTTMLLITDVTQRHLSAYLSIVAL